MITEDLYKILSGILVTAIEELVNMMINTDG